MYQDDALLRHTRDAARKIMGAVVAQPPAARAEVIRTALDTLRPGLFEKVDAMAKQHVNRGASSALAYEEALRIALADETMAAVRALGTAKLTGKLTDEAMRAQRIFYGGEGSGVGDSGDGLGNIGQDIAKFSESLLRNAACSPAVNTAIMGRVTDSTARDVTSAGLSVAGGISRCGSLPGQPAAAPAPELPSAPAPPAPNNTMTYVAIGAAIIGLGAIAMLMLRKPKPAAMAANRRRGRR